MYVRWCNEIDDIMMNRGCWRRWFKRHADSGGRGPVLLLSQSCTTSTTEIVEYSR